MLLNRKVMSIKRIFFLTSFVAISSCSALATAGTDTAFKYLGINKGIADIASYQTTGKTINDHLLSAAIGKDCKLGRVITKKPICVQIDQKSQKYTIFKKGNIISKNNVIDMKFPSEIYDFNKTLEKDLKKKLKNSNLKLIK